MSDPGGDPADGPRAAEPAAPVAGSARRAGGRDARHRQALPGHRRQRRRRLRPARRRGACPARRERRRQEHAHEHPRRPVPARRGRDPRSTVEPVALRSPARRHRRGGLGMVHQHFTLVPSQTVTENVLLGLDRPAVPPPDLTGSTTRSATLARRFGLTRRSAGQGLAAVGRRAAAGRDPQDALPRRPGPDHGRADRGAGAAGGRRAVPDAAHDDRRRPTPSSSSATSSTRSWPSPTASRSCAAARSPPQDGRRPGRTRADLARLMVGREVLEILDRTPFAPGPVVLSVRDVHADNDKGLPALRGVSLDVRAGEILGIAGVAGNGQSELAQVITGLRPCDGSDRDQRQAIRTRLGPRGHPARRRPRPRGPDRRRQRPEPVGRRQPDHEELPRRADRARLGRSTRRRRAAPPNALKNEYAIAAPIDRHPGAAAVRRQPPAAHPRPRDRLRAAPDGRRPADPGPRRRRHRGRPPPAARPARRGCRDRC